MKKFLSLVWMIFFANGTVVAQIRWQNVDSLFGPLPPSIHVFKTSDSLDGKPNIAFYLIADLKDRQLEFTSDTTNKRRFTPAQFYQKNDQPLVVVNSTFFSFDTDQNLNVVIRNKKPVAFNIPSIKIRKADSTTRDQKVFRSAIGISRKRTADVAWIRNDSSGRIEASQLPVTEDGGRLWISNGSGANQPASNKVFRKWKMKTAVGGGPVLIQNGAIMISNNEERIFGGKAINDKHPRTAMGYTADGKLVILVVQGRFPGIAEGATLVQEAGMLKDLGCTEALNLDGGGSSCLLINGKETITPSDKGGQRPVPAVFIIRKK